MVLMVTISIALIFYQKHDLVMEIFESILFDAEAQEL